MARSFFFFLILSGVALLLFALAIENLQPPFSQSFLPLFQEIGKPIKSFDRALSFLVPVDEIDENLVGEEIKAEMRKKVGLQDPEEKEIVQYLNALISFLSEGTTKKYSYEVFLLEGTPNAFALPGGSIVITKSLFDMIESEAELAAVLGHEMGHVERGHLFNATQKRMSQKRIKHTSIRGFAAFLFHGLTSITFSKAQEDEADEYSFRLLISKGYDPTALSTFFSHIHPPVGSGRTSTDPFHDFLTTHPYTELRFEKFRSKADQWKYSHPSHKNYVGKDALHERRAPTDSGTN